MRVLEVNLEGGDFDCSLEVRYEPKYGYQYCLNVTGERNYESLYRETALAAWQDGMTAIREHLERELTFQPVKDRDAMLVELEKMESDEFAYAIAESWSCEQFNAKIAGHNVSETLDPTTLGG